MNNNVEYLLSENLDINLLSNMLNPYHTINEYTELKNLNPKNFIKLDRKIKNKYKDHNTLHLWSLLLEKISNESDTNEQIKFYIDKNLPFIKNLCVDTLFDHILNNAHNIFENYHKLSTFIDKNFNLNPRIYQLLQSDVFINKLNQVDKNLDGLDENQINKKHSIKKNASMLYVASLLNVNSHAFSQIDLPIVNLDSNILSNLSTCLPIHSPTGTFHFDKFIKLIKLLSKSNLSKLNTPDIDNPSANALIKSFFTNYFLYNSENKEILDTFFINRLKTDLDNNNSNTLYLTISNIDIKFNPKAFELISNVYNPSNLNNNTTSRTHPDTPFFDQLLTFKEDSFLPNLTRFKNTSNLYEKFLNLAKQNNDTDSINALLNYKLKSGTYLSKLLFATNNIDTFNEIYQMEADKFTNLKDTHLLLNLVSSYIDKVQDKYKDQFININSQFLPFDKLYEFDKLIEEEFFSTISNFCSKTQNLTDTCVNLENLIIQFDVLQHQPKNNPILLNKIDEGYASLLEAKQIKQSLTPRQISTTKQAIRIKL